MAISLSSAYQQEPLMTGALVGVFPLKTCRVGVREPVHGAQC